MRSDTRRNGLATGLCSRQHAQAKCFLLSLKFGSESDTHGLKRSLAPLV